MNRRIDWGFVGEGVVLLLFIPTPVSHRPRDKFLLSSNALTWSLINTFLSHLKPSELLSVVRTIKYLFPNAVEHKVLPGSSADQLFR